MNESLVQTNTIVDEETIDILPLLMAIYKKWFLILIAAILFGAGAWLGSHLFLTPTYRTSCRVYVNNMLDSSGKTSVTSSDLNAARSLANTYADIISGRTVLEEAARNIGLERSYSELNHNISVSTGNSSEIITISVVDASPEIAQSLANSIIAVSQDHVANIVDGSSMRVIDEPYLPTGIYSPSYVRNAILGALLGALAMMVVVVLQVLLDNRVMDEDMLEKRFGIVVLGSIPDFDEANKAGSYGSYGAVKGKAEVKA